MPVTVEWDNDDQTIIRVTMVDFWRGDEADRAFADCGRMLSSIVHRAGILVDLRRSFNLSPLAMAHLHQMAEKDHPNAAITVFVGGNTMFLPLGSVISLFRKKRPSTFAPTLESARRIIRNVIAVGAEPDRPAG